jgi:uncharacterized membrane protein YccC
MRGCAATVVLVPSLSASPELLSLALWTGLCLYLSLLDRSARSYVFLLGGYSAALIGFPLVDAPTAMFDTAAARVQEARQARTLYVNGKTAQLDALDAMRTLAASEAALAASEAQLADDQFAVFMALGGGWEAQGRDVVAKAAP